jgi:hypothetical protein
VPSDLNPVPAHAVYGGELSGRSSAPEGTFVMAGGVDWVGAPEKCRGKNPKGWPCGARPLKDKPYCVGHQRAFEKRLAQEAVSVDED